MKKYSNFEAYVGRSRNEYNERPACVPAPVCVAKTPAGPAEWWLTPTGAAFCTGFVDPEKYADGVPNGAGKFNAAAIEKVLHSVCGELVVNPDDGQPVRNPDNNEFVYAYPQRHVLAHLDRVTKVPGWHRFRFPGATRERYAYIPDVYDVNNRGRGDMNVYFVEYPRGKVCPWSGCRAALVVIFYSDLDAPYLCDADAAAIIPCYASDE